MLRVVLIITSLLLTSSTISLAEDSDDGVYEITENCGETKIRLVCDQKNLGCSRTEIYFQLKNSPEKKIELPEEIQDDGTIFPMGIACHMVEHDNYVIQIMFHDIYILCNVCEFSYLYDTDGNQLTKYKKPLFARSDTGKKISPKILPNYSEYINPQKKFDLKMKDINYLYVPYNDQ